MEFSFNNERKTKLVSNLALTMDYDSGYMSHNPESNLDSSLESNSAEDMLKNDGKKHIYLSEDALLEKPEINGSLNLSLEIENENYEERRRMFYSPQNEQSDTVISDSVTSQETNYSAFNCSEVGDSISPVIPPAKLLVIDPSIKNTLNNIYSDEKYSQKEVSSCTVPDTENNFTGKLDKQDLKCKLPSALTNITNTLTTNESTKKLTLIFSKADKENIYSVKRKFQSLSPKQDKSFGTEDSTNANSSLEESYESEKSSFENNVSTTTETDKSTASLSESMDLSNSCTDASNHISLTKSIIDDKQSFEVIENDISETNESVRKEVPDSNSLMLNTSEVSNITGPVKRNDLGATRLECFPDRPYNIEVDVINISCENITDSLTSVEIKTVNSLENITDTSENVPLDVQANTSLENITDPSEDVSTNIKADISFENISNATEDVSIETTHCENNTNSSRDSQIEIVSRSTTSAVNFTETSQCEAKLCFSQCRDSSTTSAQPSTLCQIDENSHSLSNISTIVVNHNFEIPEITNISATPVKKFQNPIDPNISPDLFGEEETTVTIPSEDPVPVNTIAAEKYINKKDQSLLNRVHNSLKGVLPPHSVTVVQMSIDEMLNKIEENKNYFWDQELTEQNTSQMDTSELNSSNQSFDGFKSLLISEPLEVMRKKKWPAILEGRCLGVHFNRSKVSEQLEELCSKYAQRYVGAETQSSCTSFEVTNSSPLKRRQIKQRWSVKSPGRRLSHLARRRITFSSANLQASSSFAGSRARQILVDAKKLDLLKRRSPRKSPRKTPKKTPSKSPRIKTRTPSSSAKKKLAMRFRKLTGEIETTSGNSNSAVLSSKRALFRSPERDKSSFFAPSTSGVSAVENEVKKPIKRALFMSPSKSSPLKYSPFKKSPFKHIELGVDRKRKRSEADDFRPNKLSRTVSESLKPSESEVKTLERNKSAMNINLSQGQLGELSVAHKKKLQWAVYEALRGQEIKPSHPQFRLFASILARVTRRLLPFVSTAGIGKEMGTSERMLRITRHHVFAVIKGKSVDEIVNEHLKVRSKQSKPQGYIGIEEYSSATKKENVLQDRSNMLEVSGKKKVECVDKAKSSSNIERIRKVINFGDDDNR